MFGEIRAEENVAEEGRVRGGSRRREGRRGGRRGEDSKRKMREKVEKEGGGEKCVHKTQEVIIDYILWCQIYFLKRGQRRFWSLFQYFPHFFHSFSHYSCVPSCCCSFIQSFISVTVIFFLLLISFCPLFLCFCFVVTLHLFSVIIGAFHPSSFFRVFLNLFAFFFVICNFFQLSCTCLFFTIVHDFVLSFFVPFVSTANNPSNSKFSHAFLVAQACFIPSCPPVSALLLTGLHCTCTASISFSLFCLSSLSI